MIGYIYNDKLEKIYTSVPDREGIEAFKNKTVLLVKVVPFYENSEERTYCFPIERNGEHHIFYYGVIAPVKK